MKKSRFTESQVVKILKEYEAGKNLKDLCPEHSISDSTFYNWKKKYRGMDTEQLKELKALREENSRLKRMYVEQKQNNEYLTVNSQVDLTA